jgi:transcriptional regulator with GAF, ATPase, and Fis domain
MGTDTLPPEGYATRPLPVTHWESTMAASLMAIAGPMRGQIVSLTSEALSIGRSSANQLCITDLALSRQHCRVSCESERAIIRDLDSLNGTFVNALPIRERVLEHGDQVKIGHSVFVFVLSETSDIELTRVPVSPQDPALPTIRLSQHRLAPGLKEAAQAGDKAVREGATTIRHAMIGESARMGEVYSIIARAARSDTTVLIRGQSGTGKELAARAIHQNSRRAVGPFMSINSAALTETLVESELFGHEKGAFTGAIAQKKGRLEIADRGTVFFDEIGEMAPPLQAKMLRVIQEREFERVGGTRTLRVDVRIITATNKNLEEAVKKGEFREDLYYRLNVIALTMPPLRERIDDIPLLAAYFISKYSGRCGRRVIGLSQEARAHLMNYEWPGNVRELENAIERAIVLGNSDRILPEDLPEPALEAEAAGGVTTGYHAAIRDAKRRVVMEALQQTGGRFNDAARSLGVHPNYLHRLVRALNLREEISR